ncbi:MAG: hypothetical protein WAN87_00670 [Thermoplasmata archaeon]
MSAPVDTTPANAALPSHARVQLPSLPGRCVVGGLITIVLFLLLVLFPVAILNLLTPHGLTIPIPISTIQVAGILLAFLVGVRYILKPTRAMGPTSMAISLVTLLYLWSILPDASVAFSPGGMFGITIGLAALVTLLLLVPVLGLVSGAFTTYEDFRHPGERLALDYPAPNPSLR